MTLKQFIKKMGGPEAAAAEAGVRHSTVWRWLKKISKPKGNNARRLRQLGVEVAS